MLLNVQPYKIIINLIYSLWLKLQYVCVCVVCVCVIMDPFQYSCYGHEYCVCHYTKGIVKPLYSNASNYELVLKSFIGTANSIYQYCRQLYDSGLVCTYPCHHLPSILAVNSASNEGNPTLIIVLPIIIVLLITSLVIAVIIIWICVERFRKMKHSTCGKTNKQM